VANLRIHAPVFISLYVTALFFFSLFLNFFGFRNSAAWLGVSGLTEYNGNSAAHHSFNIITHYYVSTGKEHTGSRRRLDSPP
jgi:hypothetical protein